ncbi:ABC transporter substrate-binding protein [bacterium]|nr:ABC transporter substrate-binding protein [bacterium]
MTGKQFFKKAAMLLACLAMVGFSQIAIPGSKAEAVNKIRIPVLGPSKFYPGQYQWNAAVLTADLINRQGGVNVGGQKYMLDLVEIDTNDLLSVSDAVNAMERACSMENADFIIAGARSEATLAMMDIAADHKKIYLDVNSAHPNQIKRVKEDYDRYKYFFRISTIVDFTIISYSLSDLDFVGQIIKKELGIEKVKVAVVLDKAAYADPLAGVAKGMLPAMGYELVGIWRPSYSAKDLFAEASAVKTSGAQLIWGVLSGPSGQAFVNAWSKLKVPAAYVGTVTDSQRHAFWKTTGGAANYIASYDSIGRVDQSPTTIDFYDRYFERFGEKPGWGSPFVEGALLALKDAIERAGTLDTEKVIVELEKTDLIFSNGRLKFGAKDSDLPHQVPYGEGYRSLVSFQWRDGKQLIYFPAAAPLNKVIYAKSPQSHYLEKLKFKGTVDYQLPPWMVDYWKKNQ